jgi:hypothetical protein
MVYSKLTCSKYALPNEKSINFLRCSLPIILTMFVGRDGVLARLEAFIASKFLLVILALFG